ncbi:MAG: CoA transferase subunit A [Pseudooceanicola nanhaiensis]|uniref:CoA transferase subunit A n=1 Tax=Rhodobacterales TaxID=204455 RepID=UPI0040596947
MSIGTRREKRVDPSDLGGLIADWLPDGGLLALGGLFKQNRPVALVHEVLKTGRKDLQLVSSPGSGYDADLMIAAGAVAETYLAAVTLEDRMCPAFRGAVEGGRLKAHCVDALSVVGGLLASANGVSFQPVSAWKGSDVVKYNPLVGETTCPFTGAPIYAARAIRPDLALLHAQEGDVYGNIRHLSTMTYADLIIARAAKRVIVSVDRIVSTDDIVARSRETSVPCNYVDAVVHLPHGAHPTGSFPLYSIDEAHIASYADTAEAARKGGAAEQAALDDWLSRHVTAPPSHADYIAAVGGPDRMQALEREAEELSQ